MQRTPAQSAEQRGQSAKQSGQPAGQCSQPAGQRTIMHEPASYLEEQVAVKKMLRSQTRAFLHLKTQEKALREVVAKDKESSIKRQMDFLTSALKDYNCICEKAVMDPGREYIYHDDKPRVTGFLEAGLNKYNKAMSLADDFFGHPSRKKRMLSRPQKCRNCRN
jgi:hypothetical protein